VAITHSAQQAQNMPLITPFRSCSRRWLPYLMLMLFDLLILGLQMVEQAQPSGLIW
jgi:hypothetical protein